MCPCLLTYTNSQGLWAMWGIMASVIIPTHTQTHGYNYLPQPVIISLHTHVQASNQFFRRPLNFAQFYYMDKFLLLAYENSLHLYKYHIDTAAPDDIKRYSMYNWKLL